MKLYIILIGLLLMQYLNTFDCKSYQPKVKRSVFDMISKADKENSNDIPPLFPKISILYCVYNWIMHASCTHYVSKTKQAISS